MSSFIANHVNPEKNIAPQKASATHLFLFIITSSCTYILIDSLDEFNIYIGKKILGIIQEMRVRAQTLKKAGAPGSTMQGVVLGHPKHLNIRCLPAGYNVYFRYCQ